MTREVYANEHESLFLSVSEGYLFISLIARVLGLPKVRRSEKPDDTQDISCCEPQVNKVYNTPIVRFGYLLVKKPKQNKSLLICSIIAFLPQVAFVEMNTPEVLTEQNTLNYLISC